MSTELARQGAISPEIIEKVVVGGDLKALTTPERVSYYKAVCDSCGLNPLTQPFGYLSLNGKMVLYALKSCTDQLRRVNHVSVSSIDAKHVGDLYIVTCQVRDESGRTDASTGAVHIGGLKGDALANAIMKAETKAKRRATLSLCGLSILDETEVETIQGAAAVPTQIIHHEPPSLITEQQRNRIIALGKAHNADAAKIVAFYKVPGIKDLPASNYEDCCKRIEASDPIFAKSVHVEDAELAPVGVGDANEEIPFGD
jgi:hypothetical protein